MKNLTYQDSMRLTLIFIRLYFLKNETVMIVFQLDSFNQGLFQDQTEVKKHLDDANGPHFILSVRNEDEIPIVF